MCFAFWRNYTCILNVWFVWVSLPQGLIAPATWQSCLTLWTRREFSNESGQWWGEAIWFVFILSHQVSKLNGMYFGWIIGESPMAMLTGKQLFALTVGTAWKKCTDSLRNTRSFWGHERVGHKWGRLLLHLYGPVGPISDADGQLWQELPTGTRTR